MSLVGVIRKIEKITRRRLNPWQSPSQKVTWLNFLLQRQSIAAAVFLFHFLNPFSLSAKEAPYQWRLMETDHFNFYHHPSGEQLVKDILPACVDELVRIEDKIGYRLSGRLDIYLFPTPYEMEQALDGFERHQYEDRGGLTLVQPNTIYIAHPGSRSELINQLSEELAGHLLTEMLYGGTVQERIKYATLLHLPEWFRSGLSQYLSRGWDSEADNLLRDAFNSERFKSFNSLSKKEQILAGRSIWHYIEVSEGLTSVQRILHFVRLSRKVETALYYETGKTSRDIYAQWYSTMASLYAAELKRRLPTHPEAIAVPYPQGEIIDIDLSPDAVMLAISIVSDEANILKLYNRNTQSTNIIYQTGKRNNLLCRWLDNEHLMLVQSGAKSELIEINISGRSLNDWELDLDYIHSFDIDQKSRAMAVSGIRNGQSDIYHYDPVNGNLTALTMDAQDDLNPSIDELGNIYFSRDQLLENGRPSYSKMDVYLIVHKNGERLSLQNVSRTEKETELRPIKLNSDFVSFISDRNGIYNAYAFNRNEEIYALSDYQSGIIAQVSNKPRTHVVEVILHSSAYQIFVSEIDANAGTGAVLHPMPTLAMREFLEMSGIRTGDTLAIPQLPDSVLSEQIYFQSQFPIPDNVDSLESIPVRKRPIKQYSSVDVPGNHIKLEVSALYLQLNNSNFLTSTFPAFFNPNDHIMNRFGFAGGVRIEDAFKGYELNALARTSARFDHVQLKINFARLNGNYLKFIEFGTEGNIVEHDDGFLRRRYRSYLGKVGRKINDDFTLWLNQNVRYDGLTEMSSGGEIFGPLPENQLIVKHGLELNLDKSRSQFHWGQTGWKGQLSSVLGFGNDGAGGFENRLELEYGRRILHHFVWLNRLHAGGSIGKWRSIYFIGGQTNQIDPNYKYSSLLRDNARFYEPVYGVRNMPLNSRNGNTYSFINSEFYIPIHKWIGRKPIRNNVLRNLWIINFIDAGSAWYGTSPFDRLNPANRTDITSGPLNITVYNTRYPVVYSFGSGLRTKIFGYDVRYDLAWTYDNNVWGTAISGFSLGKAF